MSKRLQDEQPLNLLRQELSPYPGRIAGSLRDTLGVIIAIIIAMTLRVPGIALALALLFLMQRERPGLTWRVGLQIFSGAAVACFGSFAWVQLTDGTDVARFLGVGLLVFVSAFCMAGTTLPLFWTIVGFYGFVDLAAWDAHRSSDAIVTSSLYNLASLGIVVLSATAVEYIFGTRHPAEEMDRELQKRLTSLQRFFSALAGMQPGEGKDELAAHHRELILYAHAGDVYLNELYDRLKDSNPDQSQVPLGIHYRIGLLTRVLDKTVVLGFHLPGNTANHDAYRIVADLCDDLAASRISPEDVSLPSTIRGLLREIYTELRQYAEVECLPIDLLSPSQRSPAEPQPLRIFLPGVFDSSDAVFYALKLTLAAVTCYIIYNAIAWPGILTCVVTVLFTGLSSTGAMKQKQLYRVSGAAIGGLLAILAVSILYPNMDSITSLVIVVAPVAFLSGWVLRSPHISYVGVQIGFGFCLTALPGFSATTQIAPARDRVIGVALGILVMWFIFDQLWPVRTTDTLRDSLMRIRKATAELHGLRQEQSLQRNTPSFRRLRSAVSLELANVQQLSFSAQFEIGRHRKRELAKTRKLLLEIERSSAEFYSTAVPVSNS